MKCDRPQAAADTREVVVKTIVVGALIGVAMSFAVATAQAQIKIGIAGPLTGSSQDAGQQQMIGAQRAVTDINANGGLLGQTLEAISVDDACEPKQAEAVARQLVSQGVVFVDGHVCSAASIAASPIYEAAGVVIISPASTNPKFTEQGRLNVFRLIGRDDQQGVVAGDYLADHYANKKIAIVNDGQVYGLGLAEQTKKQLNRRGVAEVMFESYAPEQSDYSTLVEKLVDAKVDVLYAGGYADDIALITRLAKKKLPDLKLVAGDALATEHFPLIAGDAGDGAYFTFGPDFRLRPEAATVVAALRSADSFEPIGYTLNSYGAVQAWAEAVKRAGSLEPAVVIGALHKGTFDTVLGTIGFDKKGDVTGMSPFVWYVMGKQGYTQVIN